MLSIFLSLPADQRLRCAEVCRGWRATVAMPALWRRLDLSFASGVVQPVSDELLHAAVTRAGDALMDIDVSDTRIGEAYLAHVLRSSRALVEVRLGNINGVFPVRHTVTTLLAAAPQLRELHAGVTCSPEEAVELLENRPPFAPLRLHFLSTNSEGRPLSPALARALADARLQPGLARLQLSGVNLRSPGALDALVDDVVIRRRLSYLCLGHSDLSHMPGHALARMLRNGALTDLVMYGTTTNIPYAADAVIVGDALRANSTLTSLNLQRSYAPVVTALLDSLAGHCSLRSLSLDWSYFDSQAAAAALAALLVADAPALTELCVFDCHWGEGGLAELCDALPRNSHLRTLNMNGDPVSASFIRDLLLPAVRANTGLRTLHVSIVDGVEASAAAKRELLQCLAAR